MPRVHATLTVTTPCVGWLGEPPITVDLGSVASGLARGKDHCATAGTEALNLGRSNPPSFQAAKEPPVGFEPTTSPLLSGCSTS